VSDVSIIVSTNASEAGKKIRGMAGDVVGAAAQAKALATAMNFLDSAFNKGKISGEQYSNAIQKLDRAEDNLYASIGKTNTAIKQQETVVKSTAVATSNAAAAAMRLSKSQRLSGKSTNRFGLVAQQVGYQVGDFNVQVQSGTNALVAFGQQGTQLAGLLPGVAGAVLGIGLSLATAFLRSKEQTEGLSFSFRAMKDDIVAALTPIQPLLNGIGKAASAVANLAANVGNTLVENLDRVATYALVAAGAFAGKFVAGLVAARVATFSLAGAFAFLRTAIMRTGIGLIIVGVAELILLFGKMSKAVGGFGSLLELLKDAFLETLGKINSKLNWLGLMAEATFWGMVKSSLMALDELLEKVNSDFVNKFIGAFAGAMAAVKEYIMSLPEIFVAVFNSVKLAVANGVNSFTGVIGEGINKLREKLSLGKIKFEDVIDTSEYESGNVGGVLSDVRDRIQGAYSEAASVDYITAAQDALAEAINQVDKNQQQALKTAVGYDNQLRSQTPAIAALKEAFDNLQDTSDKIDLSSWFTGSKKDEGDKGSLSDALTEAQQRVQDVADAMKSSISNAFVSMVDGTKSVKDAFKDMAREIIKKLYEVLVVQRLVGSFDAQAGTGSGIVGAIMGAFQANGGVWSGGSQVKAFADGGVVGGPTTFPMAGGKTGLMGEAGPEAIMPLKRGANGKLGVQAEGGSQGNVVVNQSFNFSANGDDSVKKLIAQAAPQIANMTQKQIMDSRRRGGAMKSAFG